MFRNSIALHCRVKPVKSKLLHATAVAINGYGVLITGPSGSGKSDLALRMIDRGAKLVSDDAVAVIIEQDMPVLSAAPNIEALLEIRGIGIQTVPSIGSAPLRLVVELTEKIERMPTDHVISAIEGYDTPCVKLNPFEPSAPIKLEYALRSVVDADQWPVARSEIDTA
jgi:HPr kinase/phosphorylase